MTLDAYQRGNRDGLLAFAAWAEAQSEIYGTEVERCAKVLQNPVNRVQQNAAGRIEANSLTKMIAFRDAAKHARQMAEQLPMDPKEEP